MEYTGQIMIYTGQIMIFTRKASNGGRLDVSKEVVQDTTMNGLGLGAYIYQPGPG